MAEATLTILGQFKDNISKKLSGLQKTANGVKSALTGTAAKLTAAFGGGALLKGIVDTNAEFDKLEAQISTFSSSAEEAAGSMALIQDVTQKTPFQLNEVTTAFTRMKALGLDPSREALMAFGDVAAGSGKSILQFTEAVADAAVGEFERLKEFGIKASKQGEQVKFTFKGVTTEVKNSSQDIQRYLTEMGQNQFGGAMDKQMKTFSGSISNAKDQFALLARSIGEAGLNDMIASFAQTMGNAAKYILENVGAIKAGWAGIADFFFSSIENLRYGFTQFTNGVQLVFAALFDFIMAGWNMVSEGAIGMMNGIIRAYNALPFVDNVDEIKADLLSVKSLSDGIVDSMAEEEQRHKMMKQTLAEVHQERLNNIEAADKQKVNLEEFEAQQKANIASTQKETAVTEDNTKAKKENASEVKKQSTVYSRMYDRIKDQRIETQQSHEAQTLLNEAYKNGEITSTEYNTAMEQLNRNLGITNKEVEGIGTSIQETQKKTQQATQQMSNNFGDLFADLITGSGNAKQSLSKLLSSFISGAFSGGTQSSGSSSGSSGVIGSIVSGVGGMLGGLFKADGGPVFGNQPYIVGERGPELFMPSTNGTIMSNDKLGGTGGPISININALDGADVMRVLSNNRREITELVSGTQRTFGI